MKARLKGFTEVKEVVRINSQLWEMVTDEVILLSTKIC